MKLINLILLGALIISCKFSNEPSVVCSAAISSCDDIADFTATGGPISGFYNCTQTYTNTGEANIIELSWGIEIDYTTSANNDGETKTLTELLVPGESLEETHSFWFESYTGNSGDIISFQSYLINVECE